MMIWLPVTDVASGFTTCVWAKNHPASDLNIENRAV